MGTRELISDGARVNHRSEGSSGPTVVLLTGFQIIDNRTRDGQMRELASVASVVIHDARGSGRSSRPLDPAADTPAEPLAPTLNIAGDAEAPFVAHPDVGHCPHLSYPAMVNGPLLDFVASVTDDRNAA